MFSKTGATAATPEVIKPQVLGTGPMMVMRALGLDPDMLAGKVTEFEEFARGILQQLVDTSNAYNTHVQKLEAQMQSIDVRLAALASNLSALAQTVELIRQHLETGEACEDTKPQKKRVNGSAAAH